MMLQLLFQSICASDAADPPSLGFGVASKPPLQSSTLGVNGSQLANVLCRKVPVFGTVDDQLFVIVTGQRRIELQVPKIECDEKRPFRVAVRPDVLIFA